MYGGREVPFKLMSKAQKKERIKYLWDLVRDNIKRSKFLFRAKVSIE